IDIADVDVGENVGAKLQADQAEADKRRFQAVAEQRRAAAQAREAEMVALVQENRAQVVLAEAEIPKAMAESFRQGHLGIMDYYRMRNVQADTQMRESIGGEGARPPKE
ncbi:MAG TPA: flotillin-like FloA family protein, partial [Anaerolineales bacterium]|nr:flotillin-like FloA family protein [Anaerolineales bacterium]